MKQTIRFRSATSCSPKGAQGPDPACPMTCIRRPAPLSTASTQCPNGSAGSSPCWSCRSCSPWSTKSSRASSLSRRRSGLLISRACSMACPSMLGAAYALMHGLHIRADFLYRNFEVKTQGRVDLRPLYRPVRCSAMIFLLERRLRLGPQIGDAGRARRRQHMGAGSLAGQGLARRWRRPVAGPGCLRDPQVMVCGNPRKVAVMSFFEVAPEIIGFLMIGAILLPSSIGVCRAVN